MGTILGQILLLREDDRPFTEFVDYTLWLCGSSLTLGIVENDATIKSQLPGTFSITSSHLSAPSKQDFSSHPGVSQRAQDILPQT